MEGFSVVVAFDEVIDNSIRANARCIQAELVSDGGPVLGLVCSDDGVSASPTKRSRFQVPLIAIYAGMELSMACQHEVACLSSAAACAGCAKAIHIQR
jgi:hypothetical protein